MNRREAIETIKKAIAQVEWDYSMEIAAAFDFAIADMKICEANNAGWISVKDRLPERPENWPHCEIKRCYFLVAMESGCVKSLGFDFADMRWHTTGSPVTHWMPLPEPPKED
jgi:hypothetical protein